MPRHWAALSSSSIRSRADFPTALETQATNWGETSWTTSIGRAPTHLWRDLTTSIISGEGPTEFTYLGFEMWAATNDRTTSGASVTRVVQGGPTGRVELRRC